jgi:hypothetical protein
MFKSVKYRIKVIGYTFARVTRNARRRIRDFFVRLWHWIFPKADEVRWAIEQTLPVDEKIEWYAREKIVRLFGRVAIAATNRHLVIFNHFIFWRYYDFHPWNRLKDATLNEAFWGSSLIMTRTDTQRKVIIRHIDVERGRNLAGHARKMIAVLESDKIALGKQCPHCKELIKYTANVCPNCHSDLTGHPTTHTAPRPSSQQPPAAQASPPSGKNPTT